MRTVRKWGLAATLALGLAAPLGVRAGDDDDLKPPPKRSWWDRLFGKPETPIDVFDQETDKIEQSAKTKDQAKEQAERIARAQQAKRQADARRAREDYLRREKVLDRLMQLALEANDEALLRRIETLNERAFSVYRKKAGQDMAPLARQEAPEEKGEQP